MPEQSLSKTCVFSVKLITVFLHLGTLDTSALCLGAISNRDVNKKHKMLKSMALNCLLKGHCSQYEEKGTTEDEMVGWHHQLDGYESEQAPGAGDGQ